MVKKGIAMLSLFLSLNAFSRQIDMTDSDRKIDVDTNIALRVLSTEAISQDTSDTLVIHKKMRGNLLKHKKKRNERLIE